MNLIVDGVVFERETPGGIARLFSNVLPLLCDLDPKLRIQLFFKKTPKISFPNHKQISVFIPENVQKILRPFRLANSQRLSFQKKILQIWMGSTRSKVWLSTYFSVPPQNWKGKQVVMVHDFIYELFPEYIPGGESVVKQKALAISNADKVICNSNTTAGDLRRLFPFPDKDIFVAHLAADPIFRLKTQDQITHKLDYSFLLFVGKRGNYKNFSTLLDAYSRWSNVGTVKLVVIGPDLTEDEVKKMDDLNLRDNIGVFRHPDDETLCYLYNQALAFIYPSLYEGFGIPLLEAMQCGCPVIASQIPSTEEVAGDIPIYFNAQDPISLLSALDQLSDKSDLEKRVQNGLAKAQQYSWEKTAKVFLDALYSLSEND